jgi:hypothetical protein
MKWKSAHKSELPKNGEQILISVDGIYYLAVYEAELGLFRPRGERNVFFNPLENLIYWTEVEKVEVS